MFTAQRFGYSPERKKRRHKLALGVSAAGATLAIVAMAVPAGAATGTAPANVNYPAPSANNIIVGSGSSTTYNMMQTLDTLFNQVPGCVITSGSVTGAPSKAHQELDYSCETNSGGATLEQVPGSAYLDNPINDVAVEEPAMGSSNGIAALELGRNQTKTGIGTAFTGTNGSPSTFQNVSAINFARSSRDPSSGNDVSGLNFVAYAKDGVAPLIFTEFNSVKTSFGKLISSTPGLTVGQLVSIYNGSIYDWGQIPGAKFSAPIFVYSAQEGSGTQSTFKTALDNQIGGGSSFDPSSSSNLVNCKDPVPAGTKVITTPTKANPTPTFDTGLGTTASPFEPLTTVSTTCLGPDVIFENEDASILANASSTTEDSLATAWAAQQLTGTSPVSPVADSVFFYSYGKFNLQCEGLKEKVSYIDKSSTTIESANSGKAGANCGSSVLPTGDKLSLVPVNGVVVNPATVLATAGSTGAFPIVRFLYNVYSNGGNSNLPVATAATLNYVSEVGFLCKPQTIDGTGNDVASNEIIDPFTGVWYHTEIRNAILDNGFIPLTDVGNAQFGDLTDGAPQPENVADGTHTAYSILNNAGYGASYLTPGGVTNSSISSSSNPVGYCVVSNTDTNANS